MDKKVDIETKQFDEFWEVECPHCGKLITLEVVINVVGERIVSMKIKNNPKM